MVLEVLPVVWLTFSAELLEELEEPAVQVVSLISSAALQVVLLEVMQPLVVLELVLRALL